MKVNNFDIPTDKDLLQLYILLKTVRGTVPLNRDIGLDPRLQDKPITKIQQVIFQEVQSQMTKYIPTLTLNEIKTFFNDEGLLRIECEVSKKWN
ncbi:MAG: hypothetical protein CR959_00465 [Fusobacteriales bacterium]|nr:MAG: hypothetical protein CR959_00465 [Fusobacteriales bacterium]